MLTGHFAAALALKKYDNSIPLWVLFAASQLVDIVFVVLLLLGIEHLRIIPGFNASNDLDHYYYPFTHGLIITPLWIMAFVGLYSIKHKINTKLILILGLAVASHWLFDLFTHTPDLPLIGDSYKVGFGLMNYPVLSFALEALFIATGSWLYLKHQPNLNRKKVISVCILGVLLLIPPAIGPMLPTPHSVNSVAISGLLMYSFFIAVAYLVERFK